LHSNFSQVHLDNASTYFSLIKFPLKGARTPDIFVAEYG
jgi:hypothetical protein